MALERSSIAFAKSIVRLGEMLRELGVTRPLLVTDPGVSSAPHVALINPELMVGLPPGLTAATGMDTLSHAFEFYSCAYRQPFNGAAVAL